MVCVVAHLELGSESEGESIVFLNWLVRSVENSWTDSKEHFGKLPWKIYIVLKETWISSKVHNI